MLDGRRQALLQGGQEQLLAGVGQEAAVEAAVEVAVFELAGVEQPEDGPVHDQRLEDLRQVQGQREAAGARLVQVGDGRRELRPVDLAQADGVEVGVAEGDQGVDLVVGRAADAARRRSQSSPRMCRQAW